MEETTKRIVTSCKGSWKWQDAYKIVTYRAEWSQRKQMFLWKSCQSSRKYSEPQLREVWAEYSHGSMHNKPAALVMLSEYDRIN